MPGQEDIVFDPPCSHLPLHAADLSNDDALIPSAVPGADEAPCELVD